MALFSRTGVCCTIKAAAWVAHPAMLTTRTLVTSLSLGMPGGNWRASKGLDPCCNRYGPLSDIPDWSYADGRPAPPTLKEEKKMAKRKELAERAVQLLNELKYAKERHQMSLEEKETLKKNILAKKLKPKISSN